MFKRILQIIFLIIPITIFGFALFLILWDLILYQDNKLSFTIIQTIIIILASLSMLSFNYASALKNQKRKEDIVYCGERFLQATIFSIMGWILLYFSNRLILFQEEINFPILIKTSIYIGSLIIKFVGIPLILWGVVEVDFALKKLWKIAERTRSKYNTDDITQNWKDF